MPDLARPFLHTRVCRLHCILGTADAPVVTEHGCVMAQAVLDAAASQPLVHWVAPVPTTHAANYMATGLAQTAVAGTVNSSNYFGTNLGSTHWFWNAGLQVC